MGNVRPKKKTKGKKRNIKGKNRTLSKKYRNYINKQINKMLRGGADESADESPYSNPTNTENVGNPNTLYQQKILAGQNIELLSHGDGVKDTKLTKPQEVEFSKGKIINVNEGDELLGTDDKKKLKLDYAYVKTYNDELIALNKKLDTKHKELTNEIYSIMTTDIADENNTKYYTNYFDTAKFTRYSNLDFLVYSENSPDDPKSVKLKTIMDNNRKLLSITGIASGSTDGMAKKIWFEANNLIRYIHPYCELLEERLKNNSIIREKFKTELLAYLKMYCEYLVLKKKYSNSVAKKGIAEGIVNNIKGVFSHPTLSSVNITYNSYDVNGTDKTLMDKFFSNILHINEYIDTLNKMTEGLDESSKLKYNDDKNTLLEKTGFYGTNTESDKIQKNTQIADDLIDLLVSKDSKGEISPNTKKVVYNDKTLGINKTIDRFNLHLNKARSNYMELLKQKATLNLTLTYTDSDDNVIEGVEKINKIIQDNINKIQIDDKYFNENNNIKLNDNNLQVIRTITPKLLRENIIKHIENINQSLCSLIYANTCTGEEISVKGLIPKTPPISVTPPAPLATKQTFDKLLGGSLQESELKNLKKYFSNAFRLSKLLKDVDDNGSQNLSNFLATSSRSQIPTHNDLYNAFKKEKIDNISIYTGYRPPGPTSSGNDTINIEFTGAYAKNNMKINIRNLGIDEPTINNYAFSSINLVNITNPNHKDLIIEAAQKGFDEFKNTYNLDDDFKFDNNVLTIDKSPSP